MQPSEFFAADMDVLMETRERWRQEQATQRDETAQLAAAVSQPQLIVIGR